MLTTQDLVSACPFCVQSSPVAQIVEQDTCHVKVGGLKFKAKQGLIKYLLQHKFL